MSWKLPREMVCDNCCKEFTCKNPKLGSDGKVRCLKCNAKNRQLLHRYGISLVDYKHMLDQQNNACAICKRTVLRKNREYLCIDHDHLKGKVRGLLCDSCNTTIGQFGENRKLMRSASSYLLRHSAIRTWDEYFFEIANLASIRSKDPSTQVGAVIVRDNTILSTGYNGLPRGVADDRPERWVRPTKYLWVVHAEENAIFNATRNGVSTDGATLYVTPMHPCGDCAKAIVQAGIKRVAIESKINPDRWQSDFHHAREILQVGKVQVFAAPQQKA